MIFVQKVDFLIAKIVCISLVIALSVRPLSCIVNACFSFYVVVIYINHFKRGKITVPGIGSQRLVFIGIMTALETNDIRIFCPYPL